MSDLEKLLAAIERRAALNNGQDVIFCNIFAEICRDALGIAKEPAVISPQLLVTNNVAPEFPQWRIKYSADHEEIARRRVISLDDLGKLIREDYSWASATPAPAQGEM